MEWTPADIEDRTLRAAAERMVADSERPLVEWFPRPDIDALTTLLQWKGYLPRTEKRPEPYDDDAFTIRMALRKIGRSQRKAVFGDADADMSIVAKMILDHFRLCGITLQHEVRENTPGPHGMVNLPGPRRR
jgi:hypothetical protein